MMRYVLLIVTLLCVACLKQDNSFFCESEDGQIRHLAFSQKPFLTLRIDDLPPFYNHAIIDGAIEDKAIGDSATPNDNQESDPLPALPSWVDRFDISDDFISLVWRQDVSYGDEQTQKIYDAILITDYQFNRAQQSLSVQQYYENLPEPLSVKLEKETKFACEPFDALYHPLYIWLVED